MTPHPDPVRASFEAWWHLEHQRLDASKTPRPMDAVRFWCKHGYTAAYRAASKVSELERAVVGAADAYVGECDEADADDTPEGALYLQLIQSVTALRLHRTPPKVDRVARALILVQKANVLARTDSDQEQYLDDANNLLSAELRERDGGKP